MIAFLEQPGSVVLSRNRIAYKILATDDEGAQFYWYGSRCELTGNVGAGFPDGMDLALYWKEPTGATLAVFFEVKTIALANVTTDLPAYSSGDLASYWMSVAAKMQAHPEVNPFFQVYSTGNDDGSYSIWVVSRFYEAGWSIYYPISNAGDYTFTQYPALSTNVPDGYNVRLDIFAEPSYQSGTFERLATVGGAPSRNSRKDLEISEILHAAIREYLDDLLIPAWGTALPYPADTLRRFYIRAYETSVGEPLLWDSFQTGSRKTAIAGGISESLDASIDFIDTRDFTNSWLTWRPDGQAVGPDQPYYLSWFPYNYEETLYSGAYLEVEETDADGTVSTSYAYEDNAAAVTLAPIVFPVGPNSLGISETTNYYRVRVVQNTNIVVPPTEPDRAAYSEWRTFFVDRSHYHEVRYLAYLNGFYLPEIIRCTGDADKDLEVNQEESLAIKPLGSSDTFRETRTHRIDWRDLFTYRTGYLPRLEVETLQHELRTSDRVYEISAAGYVPLVLRGKSFPVAASRRNLHSIEITATPALLDRIYSREDGNLVSVDVDVWGSPDGIDIWGSPISPSCPALLPTRR